MSRTGYPVCFDATHSIQLPTSMGNISVANVSSFLVLSAAVACGLQAVFMEVHNDP